MHRQRCCLTKLCSSNSFNIVLLEMSISHLLDNPLEGSFQEAAASAADIDTADTADRGSTLRHKAVPGSSKQGNVHICHVCNRHYQSRDTFVKHYKKHTKEFVCRKCTQSFTSQSALDEHNSAKHSQEYLCTTCGKTLHGKGSYENHMSIHEGKAFSCPYQDCPKAFISQKLLTDHINVHTGFKPYQCDICKGKYSRRSSLSRHALSCNKKLACQICKREFSSVTGLTDHKQAEHSMKDFVCACGKRFKWRPNLSRHKKQCNNAA